MFITFQQNEMPVYCKEMINEEKYIVVDKVKVSVRKCLFYIYGRSHWCQHFLTVIKFPDTGNFFSLELV